MYINKWLWNDNDVFKGRTWAPCPSFWFVNAGAPNNLKYQASAGLRSPNASRCAGLDWEDLFGTGSWVIKGLVGTWVKKLAECPRTHVLVQSETLAKGGHWKKHRIIWIFGTLHFWITKSCFFVPQYCSAKRRLLPTSRRRGPQGGIDSTSRGTHPRRYCPFCRPRALEKVILFFYCWIFAWCDLAAHSW